MLDRIAIVVGVVMLGIPLAIVLLVIIAGNRGPRRRPDAGTWGCDRCGRTGVQTRGGICRDCWSQKGTNA